MADWKFTYQKMLGYLKGDFSNKQRYDLERNVMQNTFDSHAFDGLSDLDAEVFEKDMTFLEQQLSEKATKKRQFVFADAYKIAATLLTIFGLGIVWYQFTKPKNPAYEFVVSPEFEKQEDTEVVDHFGEDEVMNDLVFDEIEVVKTPDFSTRESDMEFEADKLSKPVLEAPKVSSVPKKIKEAIDEDVAIEKHQETVVFEETEAEVFKEQANEVIDVAKPTELKEFILEEPKGEMATIWKGQVINEDGTPLAGVTIIIEGTDEGTFTDFDGFYEIEAPKDTKLAAVYLGFDTAEFTYENAKKVVLTEDLAALEEVVVVGYGTVKRVPAKILKNADLAVAEVERKSAINKRLSKQTSGVRVTAVQKRKEVVLDQESSSNIESNTKATPPQGSELAFKNWVIAQLDPSKFDANINYTFTAEFVVDSNGKIAACTIISEAKQSLKKQLKKVILSSQNWQPAAENGLPINEKFTLQLSILAE